jgi:hypothetical protein
LEETKISAKRAKVLPEREGGPLAGESLGSGSGVWGGG